MSRHENPGDTAWYRAPGERRERRRTAESDGAGTTELRGRKRRPAANRNREFATAGRPFAMDPRRHAG